MRLTVFMFAARFSSLSSAKTVSWRRSWAKMRTTRTPESVSCRYAVICATFSRVARYASALMIRKASEPIPSTGKTRNVISASCQSSTSRITAVPTSVSDEPNSVTMPSETSWSSACTSLVRREMITPAWRRE